MRTHYCGQLNAGRVGQKFPLRRAHRRRDHGGVIFIDLRDREGLAQVVCDPDRPEMFQVAESVRNEFVLRITGKVRPRPAGTVNPNIPSGEVEVLCHEIEVLNPAVTPPFRWMTKTYTNEASISHRVGIASAPDAEEPDAALQEPPCLPPLFWTQGFIDIETPCSQSKPEAPEHLVPPGCIRANSRPAPVPQSSSKCSWWRALDAYQSTSASG